MSESLKHIVTSEALSTVETESILIQVGLQVMCANAVIDATNPVLCEAPKAFNRVGMGISGDKNFGRMMDALMLIAHRFQRIVRNIFISENSAARHRSLGHMRHQRCGLCIRYDLGDYPSFAFDHAKYSSLASSPVP